jgi:hypothetical protein
MRSQQFLSASGDYITGTAVIVVSALADDFTRDDEQKAPNRRVELDELSLPSPRRARADPGSRQLTTR